MARTWLITGCSTGLGRTLAEAVLARGDKLIATARDPSSLRHLADQYPDAARTTALDVTREDAAAAAVDLAEQAFGGLDILVNNAGYGLVAAIEEAVQDEYRPLFDTNVFGLIETTRAALPSLRKAARGRIVNISSGAGLVGLAGQGFYCATKFAVEGLSEALALEVAPFGIAVIIVEPGPFRTEFLGRSISLAKLESPLYAETAGKFRTFRAENDGRQGGDPRKAIAVILEAVDSEKPPLHLPLGPRAYSLARNKLAAFAADMDAWEARAIATDFDG